MSESIDNGKLLKFIFSEVGRACGVFPYEVTGFEYDSESAVHYLNFYLDCAGHSDDIRQLVEDTFARLGSVRFGQYYTGKGRLRCSVTLRQLPLIEAYLNPPMDCSPKVLPAPVSPEKNRGNPVDLHLLNTAIEKILYTSTSYHGAATTWDFGTHYMAIVKIGGICFDEDSYDQVRDMFACYLKRLDALWEGDGDPVGLTVRPEGAEFKVRLNKEWANSFNPPQFSYAELTETSEVEPSAEQLQAILDEIIEVCKQGLDPYVFDAPDSGENEAIVPFLKKLRDYLSRQIDELPGESAIVKAKGIGPLQKQQRTIYLDQDWD